VNLVLNPDGFYALPIVTGAPVVYVSPSGSNANPGTNPAAPLQTLAAARSKLTPGQGGAILLQSGATFVNQQLWIDGGTPAAPHVVATYGGSARTVVDVSAPTPTETALQARGACFVSDVEFVCEPGKPGVRPYGNFEAVFQNVLVRGAEVGWDLSQVTATLHRCVTIDVFSPTGDRSQGLYITKGSLRLTESVFHRCGWAPGVPLTLYASDKNHCVYVDEDCLGPTVVDGCFFGEPSSHGTQLRTGGSVRRSVYYRCPIGGFAQGLTGIIEDSYFEQQDAVLLGQGMAPGAGLRGWGWDLEATHAEMNRCAFYRGGGASPTARAIELSKVDPARTPPRPPGEGIRVSATRVAAWTGGVKKTAPDAEVLRLEVELDGPEPRWAPYSVDLLVPSFRALERGKDWGRIAAAAAGGYAALEQVIPAAPTRATIAAQAQVVRAAMDVLEAI